jgi:hypothetical protein
MGILEVLSNRVQRAVDNSPDVLILIIVILAIFLMLRLFLKILFLILSRIYKVNRAKKIKEIRNKEVLPGAKILKKTELINPEEAQEKIVGFAKPLGIWSSLILGDEITKTLNEVVDMKSTKSKSSFWENVAEVTARKSIKK